MARLDRDRRRLELKLVLWGPASGGKTALLRSVHAACEPGYRGEFASIEGEVRHGGQSAFFDYATFELPRFRGHGVRLDAYAVPGERGFEGTRRRLLQGVDAVLFVADGSPSADGRNLGAWRDLDRFLRLEEDPGEPVPVVVVVNKQDLPDARSPGHILARFAETCGDRHPLQCLATQATTGDNVLAGLWPLLLDASQTALDPESVRGTSATGVHLLEAAGDGSPLRPDGVARDLFLRALHERFRGDADGAPAESVALRRTIAAHREDDVLAGPVGVEAADLQAAFEASGAASGSSHATGRLLADVGEICNLATDLDEVVRSVLVQLVMHLDAVTGWVGVSHPLEGEIIYDPLGRARDAGVVGEAAQALDLGLPEGHVAPVGPAATTGFPGGGAGGEGLYLSFAIQGGHPGWLLLVGPPGRGLAEACAPVLRTATTFLGLAAARLHGLLQMRMLHRALEDRVEERTFELRRQKEELEERVRERTQALEQAKHAALETERSLFDQERVEGVQQLAAGVAHELNNPISAIRANLEYALDALTETDPVAMAAEIPELVSAMRDSLDAAKVVGERVTSLFGRDPSTERRAAVRTALHRAVQDGIAHFQQTQPRARPPLLVADAEIDVGIARAELTRWVFRLLSATLDASVECCITLSQNAEGPRVRIELAGPFLAGAGEALGALRSDIAAARGHLRAHGGQKASRIDLTLPPAVGQGAAPDLLERTA